MTTVNFSSDGVRLEGDLCRGDDTTGASLGKAGIPVLTFDDADFGGSEGEPPQHLYLDVQQRGYRNALDHFAARDAIDVDRLGVFGSSGSGGHALGLTSHDDARVRFTVPHVPFTGLDVSVHPAELLTVVEDAAKKLAAGEKPHLIAVCGQPCDFAATTSDSAWEWTEQMTANVLSYRKEVTLPSSWNLTNCRPAEHLSAINTPVHAVLASDHTGRRPPQGARLHRPPRHRRIPADPRPTLRRPPAGCHRPHHPLVHHRPACLIRTGQQMRCNR